MNWESLLPLLTLLTSLVPVGIIFLLPEERGRTRSAVNLAGATLKLLLIGVMLWGVAHQRRYEFRLPVFGQLDFLLYVDPLAMLFVTLSGVLWFLTTVYAIAYLEGSPHRSRFFGFFSLCVSATVGIAMSGNLFTFVMFYEVLTLSTYPLVVHRETEVSRRAGRVYLVYTLGGGGLLLAGAAWLYQLVPTVDFGGVRPLAALGPEYDGTLRAVFVLLAVGLGVKAALVPLHGWLPQAMVAPAPVSALLHAVAVVKAGAFGLVRVVYDIFGIDRVEALGLATPLAAWAAVTILYGSLRALAQDDLKRRLAYSTVSQLSYIILGIAIVGPASSVGGIVHLVHQGVMKITLFFCAGNLAETLGIRRISHMRGVGRQMPWTMAAFTAGALGMIGVPPTAGFVSKWYLGTGALEASQPWVLVVLSASTVLNAAYFLPIIYTAWFCSPGERKRAESHSGGEASWGLLVPPLVTAAAAIGVGLFAGSPLSPLQWVALIMNTTYGRAVLDRGVVDIPAASSLMALLLPASLALPVATACLLPVRPLRRVTLWLAPACALPAAVLAFAAPPGTTVDLDWLLLHMHLGLDVVGQPILVFTALLWLLAGIYSRASMADDPNAARYYFYFLLTMVGNLGLVLARDVASFYVFFAVMSLSAYPLVIHHGDADAHRAGRVYIVLVVMGEVALLVAMLLSTVARDSLLLERGLAGLAAAPGRHWLVALFLIGFGIKAGMFPLHVWLPLAHPAAPTPASALLSGAMIKAGLLGWMRFLPLGEAGFAGWGEALLAVGLVTALYGAAIGLTQRNPKAVLAYSSISQMGVLALGVGGGMLVPDAWTAISLAVLVYALHHGLSKGCLFLSVGVAPAMSGPSRPRRLLRWALPIPALALAGAPLTMGAVSKKSLHDALGPLPESWLTAVDILLPLVAFGTTLLMARFLYLVWPRGAERTSSTAAGTAHPPDRPVATLLVWLAAVGSVVAAAWLIPPSLNAGRGASLLAKSVSWSSLWPVGLGILVAWGAWGIGRLQPALRLPTLPAGDLIVPCQQTGRYLGGHLRSWTDKWTRRAGHFTMPSWISTTLLCLHRSAELGERLLARWTCLAVSLVIVLVTCLLLWLNT